VASVLPLEQAKHPVTALAGRYGHPLHPALVAVPIGAWVTSFVFDVASHLDSDPGFLAHGARWLIAIGVIGLVLWIVYVVVDNSALAWVAFVLLLPVAALGFTMLARWIPARRTGVAESRFPVPVVAGHGLFAATTLVLALLAALGIGGS
jgi:uncharacterized membrane protein